MLPIVSEPPALSSVRLVQILTQRLGSRYTKRERKNGESRDLESVSIEDKHRLLFPSDDIHLVLNHSDTLS